jgi:hypothetical protein
MIWEEVEKKYGKKNADEMKKSQFLKGITVTRDSKTGEIDIPERDIELAFKDKIAKKRISSFEWD